MIKLVFIFALIASPAFATEYTDLDPYLNGKSYEMDDESNPVIIACYKNPSLAKSGKPMFEVRTHPDYEHMITFPDNTTSQGWLRDHGVSWRVDWYPELGSQYAITGEGKGWGYVFYFNLSGASPDETVKSHTKLYCYFG